MTAQLAERPTLSRLVTERLSTLGLSYRQAANRCGGRPAFTTIGKIARGDYDGRDLGEATVNGLAVALGVNRRTIRQAAGLPPEPSTFTLPERANRLGVKQRQAVLAVIDAMLTG